MIMKKAIMNVALVCAVVAFAGVNAFKSQNLNVVGDMLLDEMEAEAYIDPNIEDFRGFALKEVGECLICVRKEDASCNVHDQVPCD